MTRISGTNIVKAPCCGAFYSTTAFASINFMASEHWTDGATENSLAQSDGGLRRCTCGGYFLSGYAERVLYQSQKILGNSSTYVRIQLAKNVIVKITKLCCCFMADRSCRNEIWFS